MHVEWYGQSAFALRAGDVTVAIDPFPDMSAFSQGRGIKWEYPAIAGLSAQLLLVTHEHRDHNGVDVVGGDPAVLRSTAGTLESPVGEVLAIASEHDDAAGTERGPNTIFAFTLDGVRVAHFGDFGQPALRPEQAAALGSVDLLFVPVGDGPTIGAAQAAEVAERTGARWIVPMHYRTERIGFLEPADDFLARFDHVARLDSPGFELGELPDERPLVVVPAAP
jgi:L-ascorbate metabolism protein UlaG (beta-lactamase superfamily)